MATRRAAEILIGGATAVALAVMATLLARRLWSAYAAAEPSRTYSVGMLVVRLTVGAVCTATAASVATRVARDRGRAAWVLGALPADHLLRVWHPYPAWYLIAYLTSLLPIAGLAGQQTARCALAPADRDRDDA